MMKSVLATAVLLASTSAFAAPTIKNFIGTYDLVANQVEGETFCFPRITISEEDDGTIGLYREDSSYGPMIHAELNGPLRSDSGSHGEALGGRKGKDSVTLDNGVLTFEYRGTQTFMGVPAGRESDKISITIAKDGKTLAVTRTTFEGPISGIGKKAKALCGYR